MEAFFSHHQAWGNTRVPSITFECFWGPAARRRVWVAWLTGSWADFLLVHSEKVISPLHSGGTLLFLWIWSSAFHVARFSLSWEKSKVSSDSWHIHSAPSGAPCTSTWPLVPGEERLNLTLAAGFHRPDHSWNSWACFSFWKSKTTLIWVVKLIWSQRRKLFAL